ncbi:hypothetical protein IBL26_18675 [Roseomonas aerophila]|uniref:Uncharacterized protein n=1 Tax=Teichococcus aerophilus TaxID=1224513 RepID=A0ABR7RR45_9PROT|nr:hypothetical protein [Pseudoroseomonas aerophila]MBC9208878.1 hypothetical protein [Pseudoroseomonas aerophila]
MDLLQFIGQYRHGGGKDNSHLIWIQHQKVLDKYSEALATYPANPTAIYDCSLLPYSKQAILDAILFMIERKPPSDIVIALNFAAKSLAYFQIDVGEQPMQMSGYDVALIETLFADKRDTSNDLAKSYSVSQHLYREKFEALQSLALEEWASIEKKMAAAIR